MRLQLPPIAAGFTAVLIGYSSSAVIVFQAARAAGATAEQAGSWMIALGIGMGLTTLGLSWRHRMPIITAWSTPGAALLATSLQGVGIAEATGAFLFSALLITLAGFSGWFERIMTRVPLALAGAMLAGILFQFGIDGFIALESRLGLVLTMFAVYWQRSASCRATRSSPCWRPDYSTAGCRVGWISMASKPSSASRSSSCRHSRPAR